MKEKKRIIALFVAPSVIFLLIISVYPMLFSFYASFVSWYRFRPSNLSFVGLRNFIEVVTDSYFPVIVSNTLYFVFSTVALQFMIGLGLAVLVNRIRRMRTLVITLLFVPFTVPPIATGYLWRSLYEPKWGMVNVFLGLAGLPTPNWLGDPSTAMLALILAHTWAWVPFTTLILSAALQGVPVSALEAARLEGASDRQVFWHIKLPWLKHAIFMTIIFTSIWAFKVFDLVLVTTLGGPGISTRVMSYQIYRVGLMNLHISLGAALSQILLVMIMGWAIFYVRSIIKQKRPGERI